jgi:hypothetical protein
MARNTQHMTGFIFGGTSLHDWRPIADTDGMRCAKCGESRFCEPEWPPVGDGVCVGSDSSVDEKR